MPRKIVRNGRRTWTEYVNTCGSDLDKLALKILESHDKDHLSCVALCRLPGDCFLIASNGFAIKKGIPEACVREVLKIDKPVVGFVTMKHLSGMHAEMKLLSALANDYCFGDKDFQHVTMGVSKPCCCLCAAVLDHYGVTFSMWHEEDAYWLSPFPTSTAGGTKQCQKDDDGDFHVELHYPKDFPHGVSYEKICAF